MSLFRKNPPKNQTLTPQGQAGSGAITSAFINNLNAVAAAHAIANLNATQGYAPDDDLVQEIELGPEEMCVQAIVGWRRWSVTMFGDELFSNNGTKWPHFEKLTANCQLRNQCHGIACGCGIYAYKDRVSAATLDNRPEKITHVWGEVSLWGMVIEHKDGYRAQFAYPKSFVYTGGIAQRMANLYGVKVIP